MTTRWCYWRHMLALGTGHGSIDTVDTRTSEWFCWAVREKMKDGESESGLGPVIARTCLETSAGASWMSELNFNSSIDRPAQTTTWQRITKDYEPSFVSNIVPIFWSTTITTHRPTFSFLPSFLIRHLLHSIIDFITPWPVHTSCLRTVSP